ncbi:MAG: hypothetical protein AAF772_14505, partial [Acidobacteriota bacterium]
PVPAPAPAASPAPAPKERATAPRERTVTDDTLSRTAVARRQSEADATAVREAMTHTARMRARRRSAAEIADAAEQPIERVAPASIDGADPAELDAMTQTARMRARRRTPAEIADAAEQSIERAAPRAAESDKRSSKRDGADTSFAKTGSRTAPAQRPQRPFDSSDPESIAWQGIDICREGDWREGLKVLGLAARAHKKNRSGGSLPSLFYAYYGYGIAKYQRQKRTGIRLCQKALEMEFYQPENYYFLARVYLMTHDRRMAVQILDRGLQVDGNNAPLLALRKEIGTRRPPVIPFLHRDNPLNVLLGRIRHRIAVRKQAKQADEPEEMEKELEHLL